MNHGIYAYWLGSIHGIAPSVMRRLVTVFGTAEDVYKADERILSSVVGHEAAKIIASNRKNTADRGISEIMNEYASLQLAGIQYISYENSRYPDRLKEIPSPPYSLWLAGSLPEESDLIAAVVGSRCPSAYGRQIAAELGYMLGKAGIPVISGMARGIDSIAQNAVLEAGGFSLAVLGCGVDVCYPKECRILYDKLRLSCGVVSEQYPGEPPKPQYFPARNRIISGMTDLVVVIEAGRKSGSLITASMALDQGRDVYAVPGRVGDTMSVGCNNLIEDGAGIVTSVESFMKSIGITVSGTGKRTLKSKRTLAPEEDMVYSCLDLYAKSLNAIERETHIEIDRLMRILTMLELEGCAAETSRGHFIRMD